MEVLARLQTVQTCALEGRLVFSFAGLEILDLVHLFPLQCSQSGLASSRLGLGA